MAESPKTPKDAEKIHKDESFRTCKTTMPTPGAKLKLRMTPARASILGGGQPFKEANSSGRKFNIRRRNVSQRQNNDTHGSNETFIRCEEEFMFDRDSLEFVNSHTKKLSSTPKRNSSNKPLRESSPKQSLPKEDLPKESLPKEDLPKESVPKKCLPKKLSPKKCLPKKLSPKKCLPKKLSPKKCLPKKLSPKKYLPKKMPLMPPPPAIPIGGSVNRRKFVTPKPSTKKPMSLMGTASRYLSQCNTSRLTRTQSYKSTAELERDYFSSLRSF